ncbi:MAG: alpha/beta hydrolase [Myxococcota bacterium]
MLEAIAYGMGIALRTGATPFVLGARLAGRARATDYKGVPTARGGLALASKIALDEIFFASEVVSATFVSLRDRRRIAEEVEQAVEFYARWGWLEDPARYHVAPPRLASVRTRRHRARWFSYQHLRFDSDYEPHAGEPGRARWLSYDANHTAHAWVLQHDDRPRPWLICVPGYRMGQPFIDLAGFRARWLHRTLGLNVAIMVMPLHGPRRVGRRGGDGFFSGDFVDTVHAQAQAVWDVRRLAGWLRDQGAPAVGAYGVSLGGYTTALLACLEEQLDCVVVGIPAVDFVRLLRSHTPQFLQRAAERIGFSFERVEQLLRVVSPLALKPLVPRERRFLYAGVADRLASPDHARDLWHHWDKPRVTWYQGSHVSYLWEKDVKALLREAFWTSGMLPRGHS